MKVYIIKYLQKNGNRVSVCVVRDAETIAKGQLIAEQIAATDDKFAEILEIEQLRESVVIHLC